VHTNTHTHKHKHTCDHMTTAPTYRNKVIELARLAKQGNRAAALVLWTRFKVKVYTFEEVWVVNLWRSLMDEDKENEVIDIRNRELVLDVMPIFGSDVQIPAQLNWIQQLEDSPYYLAGLTYLAGPVKGGEAVWMLKLIKDKGFVPMFNATHLDSDYDHKHDHEHSHEHSHERDSQ
jgi:hypothetical protein